MEVEVHQSALLRQKGLALTMDMWMCIHITFKDTVADFTILWCSNVKHFHKFSHPHLSH